MAPNETLKQKTLANQDFMFLFLYGQLSCKWWVSQSLRKLMWTEPKQKTYVNVFFPLRSSIYNKTAGPLILALEHCSYYITESYYVNNVIYFSNNENVPLLKYHSWHTLNVTAGIRGNKPKGQKLDTVNWDLKSFKTWYWIISNFYMILFLTYAKQSNLINFGRLYQ